MAQYATIGPTGSVMLVSGPPISAPPAPQPFKAGISLADKTGISNENSSTRPVMTVGTADAFYNGGALGHGTAVSNGTELETGAQPEEISETSVQPSAQPVSIKRRDNGPSFFVGGGPVSGTARPANGGPTLAEVANKLKTTGARSKHTYTNADAQRINDDLSMHGKNNTVTRPKSNQQQPPQPQQQPQPR